MSAPESRFVKACKSQPVDRTPVWFMRQAGRYMPEYRAVRKQYSLIEICKRPEVAAEVTITAAEALDVDAAIIFADLLLPLEVMGLPFHFSPGEGPVIEKPIRGQADISRLRTDRAADLGYVSEAVRLVCKHFGSTLARDWLLRSAVHAGQLHDRGRQFAQLRQHQENDVLLARGLGRADGQVGRGGLRICGRTGAGRRGRDSDFR